MPSRSGSRDLLISPTSLNCDEEATRTASTESSDNHDFWPNAITEALVLIGSVSDAAQKLFALSQFFGIQNFSQALTESDDTMQQAMLIGLLLSLGAPFIQSYCLEKDFTKNLVHYFFSSDQQQHHLNDDQRQSLSALTSGGLENIFHSAAQLNPLEWLGVYLMALVAAVTRSICTYLGFVVLGSGPAIQAIAIAMAVIDAFQICATDGHFFKNFYISLRLELNRDAYLEGFLKDMRQYLDQDYWQTSVGCGVFFATILLLGLPGLISEAGLAQLSLELFTDPEQGVMPLDQEAPAFLSGEISFLVIFSSFMFSLDVLESAKTISSWFATAGEKDKAATANPCLASLGIGLSVISALIAGVCAYQGAHFVLNRWSGNDLANTINSLLSAYIACAKAVISLTVEGRFTYQKCNQISLPSCGSLSTCLISTQKPDYRQVSSDDSKQRLLSTAASNYDELSAKV